MRAFIAVLLCSLFLVSNYASAQDAKFHSPQTDAEKALDKLITINYKSSELVGFLLKAEWSKKEAEQKYSILFTKEFLDVVVREDRKLAAKYCKEYSINCGMDYSPVTCEQFGGDKYEYKTIEETKKYAIITYTVDGKESYNQINRLINDNGKWKLDGVKCSKDEDYIPDLNFTKN